MWEFITENPLLILGILGGLISFLASIAKIFAEKQKTRFIFLLATAGFLILIVQQLIQYNQSQSRSIIQQSQQEIIDEIHSRVKITQGIVESVSEKLDGKSINQIGMELVTINMAEGLDLERTHSFAKGSPGQWTPYADWLISTQGKDFSPCLSLTLNAGNHYNTGLLLCYLLTSDKTRGAIYNIIDATMWDEFPNNEFINEFGLHSISLEWILIYDRSRNNLLAYADAKSFIKELLIQQKLGKSREIEQLLNERSSNMYENLQEMFPSVNNFIIRDTSPANIVNSMIDKQVSKAAVLAEDRSFMVSLEKIIKLAAS